MKIILMQKYKRTKYITLNYKKMSDSCIKISTDQIEAVVRKVVFTDEFIDEAMKLFKHRVLETLEEVAD